MPQPDHRLEDCPDSRPDGQADDQGGHAGADIGAKTAETAGDAHGRDAHQTLAMRIAQRNLLRAERAARLARLRPAETPPAGGHGRDMPAAPESAPSPSISDEADAALEDFLRALTGGMAMAITPFPASSPRPDPEAGSVAGAILPFQRPGAAEPAARISQAPLRVPDPAGDLARLPGAGPGLIWALRRAGLRGLEDIAGLDPGDLAARLGPLGRLVPSAAWIATARAASAPGEIEPEIESGRGDAAIPGSPLRFW